MKYINHPLTAKHKREIEKKADERISNAKSALVIGMNQPFFATLAVNLHFEPSWEIDTYMTNFIKVYYNPLFVMASPEAQIPLQILHEIMHVAFLHNYRREDRDPMLWNIAGDFAINGILKFDCELDVPDFWLVSKEFHGKTAEEIYEILSRDKKYGGHYSLQTSMKGAKDKGSDGDGDGKSGDGQENSYPNWSDQLDGNNGNGDKSNSKCPCGTQFSTTNEIEGQQKTKEQIEYEIQQIKGLVAQAATVAKAAGNLPGGLEQIIDVLFEHKVDWRAALAEFIERVAMPDYNWSRPSKRYVQFGSYLPSLRPIDKEGVIAVAIDTSGSISDKELSAFLSELSAIISSNFIKEVHFYQCDAAIHKYEVLERHDLPLKGKVYGRGGTDFRPVFDHIRKNDIDIDALIYFTDLYGAWPDNPPEYPVLWVVLNSMPEYKPPYGEFLQIESEQLALPEAV